jgi:hypothetical protein
MNVSQTRSEILRNADAQLSRYGLALRWGPWAMIGGAQWR